MVQPMSRYTKRSYCDLWSILHIQTSIFEMDLQQNKPNLANVLGFLCSTGRLSKLSAKLTENIPQFKCPLSNDILPKVLTGEKCFLMALGAGIFWYQPNSLCTQHGSSMNFPGTFPCGRRWGLWFCRWHVSPPASSQLQPCALMCKLLQETLSLRNTVNLRLSLHDLRVIKEFLALSWCGRNFSLGDSITFLTQIVTFCLLKFPLKTKIPLSFSKCREYV